MAINKHDRRRDMLVADTNSIGDFYTCASLLPEPGRTKLQEAIREYTKLRLEVSTSGASLEPSLERMQAMQARMTVLVGEALGAGTPISVNLANTLNALTSSHATRLATVRDHLPGSILSLLMISAICSALLVGRQQAYSPRLSLLGTVSFIAIVTLTFFVTLDLNQPREGLIQVSLEPMQRLFSSMSR